MVSTFVDDAVLIEEWIEATQIVLNNVPMTITGGIGYQLNNVYGTKQRQGESGPDDHPYNSTHTQRSWVQGQLVKNLQEAADVAKYWRGQVWNQTRGQLGHALKVEAITLPVETPPGIEPRRGRPEGMTVPHDRLGGDFYWTVGNVNGWILRFVPGSPPSLVIPGPGDPLEFRGTVTNVGVTFRTDSGEPDVPDTWLYIPTTAGYTRMERNLTVVQAPDETRWATLGFAVHENKLWRLTSAGQVFSLLRHDDQWNLVATLPDGSDPKQIWRDYDDDGNRVICVSTTTGMWMLDADNGMFFETDLTFPEHAFQGRGACAWRADTYVSVGVGIHRKVGTLVTAAGLDADDGLPHPFASGFITDLEPSYNVLVAAIAGDTEGADQSPVATEEVHGVTQGLPYPLLGSGTQADFLGTNRMGAIFVWNGLGWAELFNWNRPPTRVVMTHAGGGATQRYQYCFFGDSDNGAFAVRLPMTYYNPLESPNLPLARHSYLEESRIDWNTPDVPKVAKQFNIKVDRLYHEFGAGPGRRVYYNQIEVICHWRDLDGIDHSSLDPDITTGPGPYPFANRAGTAPVPSLILKVDDIAPGTWDNSRRSAPIGWSRYHTASPPGVRLLPTGLPHEQIWFEYRFLADTQAANDAAAFELTGGLIEWRTIIARKWMRPVRIWTAQIDAENAIKGMSQQATLSFLDSLCLRKEGVPFVHGDQFHVVDVTRLDGQDLTGLQPQGTRTVTLLQHTDFTYEDPI